MINAEKQKELDAWMSKSAGMLAMTRSMDIMNPKMGVTMGRKINMTIQVYLPEGAKQRDELKAFAKKKGQSMSELLLEGYKLLKEKESK